MTIKPLFVRKKVEFLERVAGVEAISFRVRVEGIEFTVHADPNAPASRSYNETITALTEAAICGHRLLTGNGW